MAKPKPNLPLGIGAKSLGGAEIYVFLSKPRHERARRERKKLLPLNIQVSIRCREECQDMGDKVPLILRQILPVSHIPSQIDLLVSQKKCQE